MSRCGHVVQPEACIAPTRAVDRADAGGDLPSSLFPSLILHGRPRRLTPSLRPRPSPLIVRRPASAAEDDVDTGEHELELLGGQRPDALRE